VKITISDPLLIGISPIINQDPLSNNPMRSPMMDTAFVRILFLSLYIGAFRTVIKCLGWDVGNVPKSIPLGPRLSVELVFIIVRNVLCQSFDLMMKGSRPKAGIFGTFNGRFKGTMSPVLISFEAAETLVGVRRLIRPICDLVSSRQ
jgi:hypothetical protein